MKNKLLFLISILVFLSAIVFAGAATIAPSGENFISASDDCGCNASVDQEKKEKDVTVYTTKTGKRFHKDGCRYLKKSKIKTTLKKACAAGHTSCKVCKPPNCPKK